MLMSLFAYTPLPTMSLFVTNFGYPLPPYPSDASRMFLREVILAVCDNTGHFFELWQLFRDSGACNTAYLKSTLKPNNF